MSERVIEKRLEFEAPVERVWKAITDAGELALWFGHRAEIDLRPGGDGFMTWENHGRYAMRIEEVVAPNRLVWSWIHEPDQPFDSAPATRVEWMLSAREGGGTVLELRETGFLTDRHYGENQHGWDEELGELTALLGG